MRRRTSSTEVMPSAVGCGVCKNPTHQPYPHGLREGCRSWRFVKHDAPLWESRDLGKPIDWPAAHDLAARVERIEHASDIFRRVLADFGQNTEDRIDAGKPGLIGMVNAMAAFAEIMSDPIGEER